MATTVGINIWPGPPAATAAERDNPWSNRAWTTYGSTSLLEVGAPVTAMGMIAGARQPTERIWLLWLYVRGETRGSWDGLLTAFSRPGTLPC